MRELKNDLSLKRIVVKLTELTESGNRGFLRTHVDALFLWKNQKQKKVFGKKKKKENEKTGPKPKAQG